MGLLDDAIREHLELMRRRGADAGEVSRQESDALAPVRRTPEGLPDPSDLPDLPAPAQPGGEEVPAVHDVPATPASSEEQTAVHAPPPPVAYEPPPIAPLPPPPVAYQPPSAPIAPPAAHEPDPGPDFDPFPEPDDTYDPPAEPLPTRPSATSLLSRFKRRREPAQRKHAAPPPDEGHEPPASAYDPPAPAYEPPPSPAPTHQPPAANAEEVPAGEDLLEETPDFLEETPEHDRLWFEQRPPRDFDFDG
jgi:hypothetical protein